jgi:hypothetical protein
MTNKNGAEGIMTTTANAYPKVQWKSKTWHTLKIPLHNSNLLHANITQWDTIQRLELYRSIPRGEFLPEYEGKKIYIRHFNFVKVDSVAPHDEAKSPCTKQITPGFQMQVNSKQYFRHINKASSQVEDDFKEVGLDLSACVDPTSHTFRGEFEIRVDVWQQDSNFFPTRLEITTVNEIGGIITDFREPSGGWQDQVWQQVIIPITDLNVAGADIADWDALKHIQMYRNNEMSYTATDNGKVIIFRNFWFVQTNGGIDNLATLQTTSTTTTDPDVTRPQLPFPDCSFLLMNWHTTKVSNNRYRSLSTTYFPEGTRHDMSCMVKQDGMSWDFDGHFEFQVEVFVTDVQYLPAKIEMTNLNENEGIVAYFSEAYAPEVWKANEWNLVRVALNSSNLNTPETTDWMNMTRLQLYRSGTPVLAEGTPADNEIKFRNFNLLKVVTTTTTTITTVTSSTTTTTTQSTTTISTTTTTTSTTTTSTNTITTTTSTTTTTTTTSTTTTIYDPANADCIEEQSQCTVACEIFDQRTYSLLTPAVKNGRACVGPTDCQPGDGACPATTSTTPSNPTPTSKPPRSRPDASTADTKSNGNSVTVAIVVVAFIVILVILGAVVYVCSFSDGVLHSREPLVPTHVR